MTKYSDAIKSTKELFEKRTREYNKGKPTKERRKRWNKKIRNACRNDCTTPRVGAAGLTLPDEQCCNRTEMSTIRVISEHSSARAGQRRLATEGDRANEGIRKCAANGCSTRQELPIDSLGGASEEY